MANTSVPFPTGLGRLVRLRRQWLDRTQKEVARTIGITQSALCSWEREQSIPTLIPFLTLLRELDVDIADVYAVIDAQEPANGGEGEAA